MLIEPRFDIVTLPSEGKFYKNKAKRVKLFYLDGGDEGILTSPNLIESGEMVDYLLRRKIAPVDGEPFVDPDNMLIGDRLALVIMLRATLDPIYKMKVPYIDGTDRKFFVYELNLQELSVRDIVTDIPYDSEKGEFSYRLPQSKIDIKFRLMTGLDEQALRRELPKGNLTDDYQLFRLARLITELNGERSPEMIKKGIANIGLRDFRMLNKITADVMPSLDLNLSVVSPRGETINTFLRLDGEFWFPTI